MNIFRPSLAETPTRAINIPNTNFVNIIPSRMTEETSKFMDKYIPVMPIQSSEKLTEFGKLNFERYFELLDRNDISPKDDVLKELNKFMDEFNKFAEPFDQYTFGNRSDIVKAYNYVNNNISPKEKDILNLYTEGSYYFPFANKTRGYFENPKLNLDNDHVDAIKMIDNIFRKSPKLTEALKLFKITSSDYDLSNFYISTTISEENAKKITSFFVDGDARKYIYEIDVMPGTHILPLFEVIQKERRIFEIVLPRNGLIKVKSHKQRDGYEIINIEYSERTPNTMFNQLDYTVNEGNDTELKEKNFTAKKVELIKRALDSLHKIEITQKYFSNEEKEELLDLVDRINKKMVNLHTESDMKQVIFFEIMLDNLDEIVIKII